MVDEGMTAMRHCTGVQAIDYGLELFDVHEVLNTPVHGSVERTRISNKPLSQQRIQIKHPKHHRSCCLLPFQAKFRKAQHTAITPMLAAQMNAV
jgi:hypothetical protein